MLKELYDKCISATSAISVRGIHNKGKTIAAIAMAVLLGVPAIEADAGTTTSYTMTAKSYSGSRNRNYKVYVPSGFSGARPLVMLLHGCEQNNDNALNEWGMKAKADAVGFILVTPFITTYDGQRASNCWGFWLPQHQKQNMGEPEDLKSIADEVATIHSIDTNKRFITGLSSGGAMAMTVAITHNEYWAASAPVAGLPYNEDAGAVGFGNSCPTYPTFKALTTLTSAAKAQMNNNYPIPIMLLANINDCTVQISNARNMRDVHLAMFPGTRAIEAACSTSFSGMYYSNWYNCKHEKYTGDGNSGSRAIVETVFFDGPLATSTVGDTDKGHYWVGGTNGLEGKWAVRTGPSMPDIIWDFFNRHSKQTSSSNGVPTITITGNNPASVTQYGTYTDAGATASDPEDGALTVTADCGAVNTSVVGQYFCNYRATDSAGNLVVASRTVNVVSSSPPTMSCATQTSSSSAHISAGRATKGGQWGIYAVTTGDKAQLGYYFTTTDSYKLWEAESGKWHAVKPNSCNDGSGGGGGGGNLYCGTASVSVHRTAGRVADSSSICKTVGGLDNVDAYGFSYSCTYQITYNGNPNITVKETTEGYFDKVTSCP